MLASIEKVKGKLNRNIRGIEYNLVRIWARIILIELKSQNNIRIIIIERLSSGT